MSEQLDKLRKLTSRTWLNSGNSSAIVNESKDDEPGFLESAWGNFKGCLLYTSPSPRDS